MSTKTPDTLSIQLKNEFPGATYVYANITGNAYNNNNQLFFLKSDGITPYYPPSPSTQTQVNPFDVAIPLGPLGSSITVTVPKLFSARIYFSINNRLSFYLNPGPALVQPSVSNPSDDNFNTQWGFCEFTYNDTELFCNVSYVDFIGLPIALDLSVLSGPSQQVKGIAANGIKSIAAAMTGQTASDGQPWSSLTHTYNGTITRILSPNQGIVMLPALFSGYFESYVQSVWQKFTSSNPLTVNTQNATWGVVSGAVDPTTNKLTFKVPSLPGGQWTFAQPSTANIFNCSNGPFVPTNDEPGNISARLAAAFNRTTMLDTNSQPDGVAQSKYYIDVPTNHYSRILHAYNLDNRGYAFPYDDVTPTIGQDLSGKVESSTPNIFTVTVGGAQWGS